MATDNPIQQLSTWPNQEPIAADKNVNFPWGLWFTQLYNFVRVGACTVATVDTKMQANGTYIVDDTALVTLTLPDKMPVGAKITVIGKGTGLWKIEQNAGQTIHSTTSTTTGITGSISSAARYDNIVLQGMVTDLEFSAISRNGALIIA